MVDVYDYAAQYREELLALDAKAARQMADAYRKAYAVMQARLKAVTDQIDEWPYEWPEVPGNWVFQQERWKSFYNSIRDEVAAYNKVAHGVTTDAQGGAIELGINHMRGLARQAFGSGFEKYMGNAYTFAKPNDAAMRAMVGFTQAGAPLASLFDRIAPEAQALAIEKMRTAIAIGQNPATLARSMQGPLGIPMWRSLTIARTETLRTYREAQRQTVLENADVLEGWVWHSARDARTCEVCWAMTGKVFPIVDGQIAAEPVAEPAPDASSFEERYRRSEQSQGKTPEEKRALQTDARAAEAEYSALVAEWRARNGGVLLPRPSDPFRGTLWDDAKAAYDAQVADGLNPTWNGSIWYGPLTTNARMSKITGIMHVGDQQVIRLGDPKLVDGKWTKSTDVVPTPEIRDIDRQAMIFHEIAHSSGGRAVAVNKIDQGLMEEGIVEGYASSKFPTAKMSYTRELAAMDRVAAGLGVDRAEFFRGLVPLTGSGRDALLEQWARESGVSLTSLGLKRTALGWDYDL